MAKRTSPSEPQERPYKTTGLHLPADLWELLNRVAFERSRTKGGRASVSALLVGACGIIGFASWLGPEVPSRVALIAPWVPSWLRDGADIAAGALGIGLMICCVGLFRRSVTALRAAMVLLVASSLVHVVKGLDIEEAALCLAVAALLYTLRPALGDHPGDHEDADPDDWGAVDL